MLFVEFFDGRAGRGNVLHLEVGDRHRRPFGPGVEGQEVDAQAAVRRVGRKPAREALLAVAPQGRGVDVGARAVAPFEPHGAFQPPLVAVERIDEVFERKAVFARLDIERKAQTGRVAQRPDADERVGEHRAREGAAGDVVDRVEHGDLLVIDFPFPFEHLDGPLDHVAQTSALALREVADGVVHVVGRVAVAGEDRLVDAQ